MRIIIADCSTKFRGRSAKELARDKRLILIKDDGSVSINEDRGVSNVGYMTATGGSQVRMDERKHKDGFTHLIFVNNADEKLDVTLYEVEYDGTFSNMAGGFKVNTKAFDIDE